MWRYAAALERYDVERDPGDHVRDLRLPDELGTVHALRQLASGRRQVEPIFHRIAPPVALCGAKVRVALQVEFDPGDDDACEVCAAKVGGISAPPPLSRKVGSLYGVDLERRTPETTKPPETGGLSAPPGTRTPNPLINFPRVD